MAVAAVPFRLSGTAERYTESVTIEGVARVEADRLVLEYVVSRIDYQDPGFSKKSGAVETLVLPPESLVECTWHPGLLRAGRIHLRVARLGLLRDLASPAATECDLRVRRRHRQGARELVATLALARADSRLRALGE